MRLGLVIRLGSVMRLGLVMLVTEKKFAYRLSIARAVFEKILMMLKFSLNLVFSPIIVHQLFFPKLNFAEHEISSMVSLIVVPLFPAQIFVYNGT